MFVRAWGCLHIKTLDNYTGNPIFKLIFCPFIILVLHTVIGSTCKENDIKCDKGIWAIRFV